VLSQERLRPWGGKAAENFYPRGAPVNHSITTTAAVAAVAIASGLTAAGTTGPDIVCFYTANDISYLGSTGGIGGYAMSTTSCNYGDQEAAWYGGTNETPLIGQNAYRFKDGRFEQLGMSWLKHSFCALSEPGCGDCQATDCNTLGIGCADTYGAGLNTNPSGPRSDVNAFTGEYPYPFNVSNTGPSVLRGNLQIRDIDVDPALNAGAEYLFEAYYISTDDAPAGNHANNASWRSVNFTGIGSASSIGSTEVGEAAIRKWATLDPNVDMNDVHVPGDGFFIMGATATDLGTGMWHYEYAVWNQNCDASAGSFSVPVPSGATVQNIGFHDVNYHSGEVYDSTDWNASVVPGSITWSTTPYAKNQNANAIRWATMYNFRFDANVAPVLAPVTIGIFKPGGTTSVSTNTISPPAEPVNPCDLPLGYCPEDVNNDHIVNVDDMLATLGSFGQCGDGTFRPEGDVNGDCCTTVDDLLSIVGNWGIDCTPLGACCLVSGGCSQGSEAACDEVGGSWSEGVDCAMANCPAPGACCYDDGSCAMVMYGDCAGTYNGDGTDCEEFDCPVAGAGDECSSAFIASVGANPFETNTATPSTPEPDETMCPSTYLDWSGSQDVWFVYMPSTDGNAHFTTCDSGSYDTSMVIYHDTCDNQVACNGDASGESGCQAYYSEIDITVTAGDTYYIRIGGYQGSTGSGTLSIE
jgi:hypothetical protein